jgi:hypothetical protein
MRCYGSIARLMPQADAADAVQLGRAAAPPV